MKHKILEVKNRNQDFMGPSIMNKDIELAIKELKQIEAARNWKICFIY